MLASVRRDSFRAMSHAFRLLCIWITLVNIVIPLVFGELVADLPGSYVAAAVVTVGLWLATWPKRTTERERTDDQPPVRDEPSQAGVEANNLALVPREAPDEAELLCRRAE